MRSDVAYFLFLPTTAGNARRAEPRSASAYHFFFVAFNAAYLTGLKKVPETINLWINHSIGSLSTETSIDTNFFIHLKNQKLQ